MAVISQAEEEVEEGTGAVSIDEQPSIGSITKKPGTSNRSGLLCYLMLKTYFFEGKGMISFSPLSE